MKMKISCLLLVLIIGAGLHFTRSSILGEFTYTVDNNKKLWVKIEIENIPYDAKFVLDSGFDCILKTEVLHKINKKKIGTAKYFDINEEERDGDLYLIPKLRIGTVVYRNVRVLESPYNDEGKQINSIGLKLISKQNILFDLGQSKVAVARNSSFLAKKGLKLKDAIAHVPFQVHSRGMILPIETDLGKKMFLLGTSAPGPVLQNVKGMELDFQRDEYKNKFIPLKKFVLQGNDFGSTDLVCLDFPKSIQDLEGLLNIDYFGDDFLYIDPRKKMFYVWHRNAMITLKFSNFWSNSK